MLVVETFPGRGPSALAHRAQDETTAHGLARMGGGGATPPPAG